MSELVLVRHGQASFGKASYDKLSELGVEQVRILARHWRALGEGFDHIYAGSLQRQQETARELLPLVKHGPDRPETHAGLNEYNGDSLLRAYLREHGEQAALAAGLEWPVRGGAIRDERTFQKLLEAAAAKWLRDELEPAGDDEHFEPWGDFKRRTCNVLDELMDRHTRGSRVLVSTSGGVIAMALQRVLKFPDEQAIGANWMVHNSSVTRIRYGNGRISLMQFNSLPHLEQEGMAHLVTYR